MCLGANGAIYAARRASIEALARPDTTSMDDFLIPARIARRGRAGRLRGGRRGPRETGRDVAAEVSRRFRIGVGAGQVLRRETWLFDLRRHGRSRVVFLSRKAARWLAPVLSLGRLVVAALGDGGCVRREPSCWRAAALLMLSVAARPRVARGLPGQALYFCVINIALAAGVVAGLAGYRAARCGRRTGREALAFRASR